MNRFIIFACVIPMFFLACCYLVYLRIIDDEVTSFEQARLQKAVNYSSDASAAEMLYVGALEMDREDVNKETVNPDIALETFCDVLSLNYNIPVSDTSRTLIQSEYLPVFAVAAYDGVYIYTKQVRGESNLVSTPKIPYTYVLGRNYYALNFGITEAVTYHGRDIERFNVPLGKQEVLRIINTRISSLIAKAIDEQYTGGFINRFYIPESLTEIQRNNPIQTVSVLAFMDNVDLSHYHRLTSFSVGGTRVENVRRVVAYIRDGTPFYCYADLYGGEVQYVINEYSDTSGAAKAGYYYDPLYMEGD
jgi:hypothetical protein